MEIYYSFKTVFAYRTKNSFRIRADAFSGYWGEETVKHIKQITISNNNYILSEKEVFEYNLNYEFQLVILKMAKDIALKGLKIC